MQGWLALDIDGTLTKERYSIPVDTLRYLEEKVEAGWALLLATGRSFTFAFPAWEKVYFSYVFLGQNGSVALEMPSKKILFRHDLSLEALSAIERLAKKHNLPLLVYGGIERQDLCFYSEAGLKEEEKKYLEKTKGRHREEWRNVDAFPKEKAPLVKVFGSAASLQNLRQELESFTQVVQIRDPFSDMHWLLITNKKASKGLGAEEVFRLKGRGQEVIAAGDDENDLSLFAVADRSIAMPHAPSFVKERADLIAPPLEEGGIVPALRRWIG